MADKKTVLLTGATGFVGGQCRKFWGPRPFRLHTAPLRTPRPTTPPPFHPRCCAQGTSTTSSSLTTARCPRPRTPTARRAPVRSPPTPRHSDQVHLLGSCAGDTTLAAHERFVLLDITQYDEFLAAAQGVDTIVHLAATPGAPDDPCAPRCFFAVRGRC